MIGPVALAPLVRALLRYAVEGRKGDVAELLDYVSDVGDAADMYGLCSGLAELSRGPLAAMVTDPAGWLLTVAETEPLPCDRFAARFLLHHLRDEVAQGAALYDAERRCGDPQQADSVCALLTFAADLHRWANAPFQKGNNLDQH